VYFISAKEPYCISSGAVRHCEASTPNKSSVFPQKGLVFLQKSPMSQQVQLSIVRQVLVCACVFADARVVGDTLV